jgi:hypothetical protein
VTLNAHDFTFAALHLGDHVINAGLRPVEAAGDGLDNGVYAGIESAFDAADYTEVLRLMNDAFGESNYSLRSLFRDEQHHVMRRVLEPTLTAVDEQYRQIYEQHAGLVRYLTSLNLPVPRRLSTPATFVINASFRAAAELDPPNIARMRELAQEAAQVGVSLDQLTLSFVLDRTLGMLARRLAEAPRDLERLELLSGMAALARELPFEINLAHAQNVFHNLIHEVRPAMNESAANGDEESRRWMESFSALGEALRVRAP